MIFYLRIFYHLFDLWVVSKSKTTLITEKLQTKELWLQEKCVQLKKKSHIRFKRKNKGEGINKDWSIPDPNRTMLIITENLTEDERSTGAF